MQRGIDIGGNGNLRGRAAGAGREFGAGVFDVHGRRGGDGQVAGELWDHDGKAVPHRRGPVGDRRSGRKARPYFET
jgi:hypothetical protein